MSKRSRCFEVRLNGKRLCIAGVGPKGVLTASVSWVGDEPHSPRAHGRSKFSDTHLHVGGLFEKRRGVSAYPAWVSQLGLKLGDRITIVVTDGIADLPAEKQLKTKASLREEWRRSDAAARRRVGLKGGSSRKARARKRGA